MNDGAQAAVSAEDFEELSPDPFQVQTALERSFEHQSAYVAGN